MNFFNSNLAALAEANPDLEEALRAFPPADLRPVAAASGDVTAQWKGVFLHSRFDPRKEAEKLLAETREAPGTLIFYGFGLGYHVERFFDLHPEGRAIVLEPDASFFRKALELRDFSGLFRREGFRLLIGTGPEALALVLKEFEDDGFKVFRLRSVYAVSEQFYKAADGVLSRFANRRDINVNTLKRFGRLWVRNLAANLPLLPSSPGIESLKGAFAGFPALVLAAGPSLDEVLPRLAEFRERFLIIAVDTSYNACLREGVEPDFVVVVDPQYWNTRHLDRALQMKAVLVSESSTHPRIFRLLPGKRRFCGSLFPLGKYLEASFAPKGTLGAGGSVSTSAWDFARVLGAAPIVMAGLDLGFPNKNTHYKGSFFEDLSFSRSSRLSPGETHSVAYLLDAEPRYVPANDGSLTLTDRRMLVYQGWFETQRLLHPEAQTFTLSAKGIRIEGLLPVTQDELLSYPVMRKELNSHLSSLAREDGASADRTRLRSAVRDLLAELDRLTGLCDRGIRLADRAREVRGPDLEEVLSLLNGVDEEIRGLEHRDVAGFLLASTLNSLFSGSSEGTPALENTAKVYSTLEESADYHRKLLQTALEKV